VSRLSRYERKEIENRRFRYNVVTDPKFQVEGSPPINHFCTVS